jgi:hypothetical protein
MPTYLVESYLSDAELASAAAVAALLDVYLGARHRWSLVLPDEEVCLHMADEPSVEVIRRATTCAALRHQRISRIELISAKHDIKGDCP